MGNIEPSIKRLLGVGEGSALARTLRGGLVGLRATMRDAIERDSQDPGIDACRDVLRWLDGLLPAERSVVSAERAATPESDGVVDAATALLPAPSAEAWRAPLRSLTQERQVVSHLGPDMVRMWRARAEDPTTRPAEFWEAVQLGLLRLPDAVARRLRDSLWATADGEPRARPWVHLTSEGTVDTVLVAPLDGESTGIRTSADAQPHADVLESLNEQRDASGRLPSHAVELAQLCSALLAVASLDDDLWLCLESLQYQTSIRLDDEGRLRLRSELLGRLREYARRPPTSAQAMRALISVDEALHAILHLPVAAPGSWWDRLSRRSRIFLNRQASQARAAGTDVTVRPLLLDYQSVREYTAGNDVAVNIGGQPGDILACLRVHARIDGQDQLGRVLYRASE